MNKKKTFLTGCSAPEGIISQSVWRAGLTPPSYTRSSSTVKHVIVHHAAGSNTATNYTEVVRNIYVYHTQANGWSDIGYNYLVAQDGSIFAGRDPGNLEQDNVLGAHFCGSNSTTMGICLLGSYESIAPLNVQIASLQKLITWKLAKEQLNPEGLFPHPKNENLGTIAGHHDGCATECPGTQTYLLLPALRTAIKAEMESNCGFNFTSIEENYKGNIVVYSTPGSSYLYIESIKAIDELNIFNSLGLMVLSKENIQTDRIVLTTSDFKPGIYFIQIKENKNTYFQKVLISK